MKQLLLNVTHLAVEHRRLLQLFGRREEEEEQEAYFVDYIPPARDAINLPRNVIYVLVGLVLVIIATYAIVGHLIKDLMHDLAGNTPLPNHHPLRVSGDHSHHSVQSDGPVAVLFPSLFFLFWVSKFLCDFPSSDPRVSPVVNPS